MSFLSGSSVLGILAGPLRYSLPGETQRRREQFNEFDRFKAFLVMSLSAISAARLVCAVLRGRPGHPTLDTGACQDCREGAVGAGDGEGSGSVAGFSGTISRRASSEMIGWRMLLTVGNLPC